MKQTKLQQLIGEREDLRSTERGLTAKIKALRERKSTRLNRAESARIIDALKAENEELSEDREKLREILCGMLCSRSPRGKVASKLLGVSVWRAEQYKERYYNLIDYPDVIADIERSSREAIRLRDDLLHINKANEQMKASIYGDHHTLDAGNVKNVHDLICGLIKIIGLKNAEEKTMIFMRANNPDEVTKNIRKGMFPIEDKS